MRRADGRIIHSPSDLNNFLECRHLTQLDLAVVEGRLEAPDGRTVRADLIARKGDEHEAAYLRSLKEGGSDVVEIDRGDNARVPAEATLAAMRSGAEVVYQGAFLHERWTGYADFLLRVD